MIEVETEPSGMPDYLSQADSDRLLRRIRSQEERTLVEFWAPKLFWGVLPPWLADHPEGSQPRRYLQRDRRDTAGLMEACYWESCRRVERLLREHQWADRARHTDRVTRRPVSGKIPGGYVR